MSIFRKIYQKIFNFNLQDYEGENTRFEELESDLKSKAGEGNAAMMVKMAIETIEDVISFRAGKEKNQHKGMRKLYYNLSKAQSLYEQVKILSEGTGTGWGSAWRGSFRKMFKEQLSNLDADDPRPPLPTLKSPNDYYDEYGVLKLKNENTNGENKLQNILDDPKFKKCAPQSQADIKQAAEYILSTKEYKDKNLKFLGKGTFNVVFRIGNSNRVVKYCKHKTDETKAGDRNSVSFDEMTLREFEAMLKSIKDDTELKKWSEKYLSKTERKNEKDIYEDKLATGDLQNVTVGKRKDVLSNNPKKTKSMDSLLKKAKKAAKGLLVLHNSGYVHQDIKPANILHLPNPETLKSDDGKLYKDKNGKEYTIICEISKIDNKIKYFKKYKSGEKRKISKNTVNIADYGLMRKINNCVGCKQSGGTPGYIGCEDMLQQANGPDDVKKRDVYALGMTFAALLCGGNAADYNWNKGWQWGMYPAVNPGNFDLNDKKIFNLWYRRNAIWQNLSFSDLYGNDEEERVYHFVKLINDMTGSRKNRPLMDGVIAKIREIENLKKG